MMRIAILMQDTAKVYGAHKATVDLITSLNANPDIRLTVLLIEEVRLGFKDSALRQMLHEHEIDVRLIPTAKAFSSKLIGDIRLLIRQYDIQLLHTIGPKADFHGILASRWTFGIPVVATVHGWLFRKDAKERVHECVDGMALKYVDKVVSLSTYYRNMLHSRGIREDHLVRIPTGLAVADYPDEEDTDAVFNETDSFCVGFMGRFSEEKNHAMLLEAASLLADQHRDIHFLIAGDGPLFDEVQQEIKRLKLRKQVTCPGYMDSAEFMRQIHMLAMCSTIENQPYTIMEAMSWKRPVVATRVGGLPELVDHEVTGYLVELGDSRGLADHIVQLRKNYDLLRLLGGAGRAKLRHEFDHDSTVQAHLALYEELIGKKKNRPA